MTINAIFAVPKQTVGIAQLVRASDCGSEGRRFEPDYLPVFFSPLRKLRGVFLFIGGLYLFLLKINFMITAEIKLPEKDAEMILKVISKLGGKIKLIETDNPKLSPAAKKMKADLEKAFKEVKLHQEGKIKLKTARELLDEL